MLIPPRSKYATLALQTGMCELASDLEVAPGVVVSRGAPFTMPEHWTRWLGDFAMSDLAAADVHITAVAPSHTLEILDDENARLLSQVQHLYAGLLISAPGVRVEYGRSLTGAFRDEGHVDLRQSQQQNNVYRVVGTNLATRLTTRHFKRAYVLGERLRKQRAAEGRDGYGRFSRLKLCISALYSCIESRRLDHRLHQAVRVIEGLMGSGREEFRKAHAPRLREFVLADEPRLTELPDRLYTLRSKVEHLYGASAAVVEADLAPSGDDRSAYIRFAQATHAAEFLAQSLVSYVVENESLWWHFSEDSRIGPFWKEHAQLLWTARVGKALHQFQKTFDPRAAGLAFDENLEDQALEEQLHSGPSAH